MMEEESKVVRRAATEITQEESGWTSYFDDFFATQQRNNLDLDLDDDDFTKRRSNYGLMVSDAASFVDNENQVTSASLSSPPPPPSSWVGGGPTTPPLFTKKLNFIKKTRTREISYDDSLEDTASSPVNSPKVGSVNEVGFNIQRKTEDNTEVSFLGKVGGSENHLGQKRGTIDDQRDMVDFEENINNSKECTNLRERGLCLVPMSIFMNYLV